MKSISDIDVLCTGNVDWIARTCAHADKDTYSASAEDIEVQSCFLDDQLTNLSPPRNCMPPVYSYANRDNSRDLNLKKQLVRNRCPSDTRDPC
ncbi:hypothetical protein Tco_0671117 [Tanacetum coccineum]